MGLLHLVVLSGTNIQILAGIIGAITSRFSKIYSILITILFIILFVIFVSPEAPIVRAAFISILTLVSIVFGRKPMALYLLFLSALLTAVIWPSWINTISFQLSYGASLGLILFAKKPTPKNMTNQNNIYGYIKDELRTTLSAQVFTVPIIFYYFKEISFIAPVANILVSWLIAPIMIFGSLAALIGKIFPFLGLPFAFLSYGLTYYLVFVIEHLSKLPYAFISFK